MKQRIDCCMAGREQCQFSVDLKARLSKCTYIFRYRSIPETLMNAFLQNIFKLTGTWLELRGSSA